MPRSHAIALIVLFIVALTPSGVKVGKYPSPPTGWNLRPQPPAGAAGAAATTGHWSGAPLGKNWGAGQPERLTGSAHPAWTGKVHHGQQPSSSAGRLHHVQVNEGEVNTSAPYKEYHGQSNFTRGFTVHYEQTNFTQSSWYNSTGWKLNHTWCHDHQNSTLCKFARWRTNHTLCHGRYNGSRCNFTYHSHYNHTYRHHYNHTYHNKTYHYNSSRTYPTSPVANENETQEKSSTIIAPPWKQYQARQNTEPTLKVHYDHPSSPNEGGQGSGTISPSIFRTGAHFQNLAGARYDVNQPGEYLLLRVPKDENETAHLEVWGHFLAAADAPCELYTRTVTISGKLFAEKKLHVHALPYSMKVSQVNASYKGKWRSVEDYFAVMSHLHEREVFPHDAISISPINNEEGITSIEVRIHHKLTNNSTRDGLRPEQAVIRIAPRSRGLDVAFSSVLSLCSRAEQFGGLLGNDRHPYAEMQRGMCEAFVANATDVDLQALYEESVGSQLFAS